MAQALKFLRVVNKGKHPQAFDWNGKTHVLQPHPSHNAGMWACRYVNVYGEPKTDPRTVGPGMVPSMYRPCTVELQWEKISDELGGHIGLWPEDMVSVMRQTKRGPAEGRNSVVDLEFDADATDDFALVAASRKQAQTEADAKLAQTKLELAQAQSELERMRASIAATETARMVEGAKKLAENAGSMKPPK
jgi:hypothetical protein